MGLGRPLLLAVTGAYVGPWVPLLGLKGRVEVTGLKGGDEVVILSPEGELLLLTADGNFALPEIPERIRAWKRKSNGSEVFVWAT